jgi:ABC-type transporter Mla subunit MlaD
MRIRKFNESEQIDISSERIAEIVEELSDFSTTVIDKSKYIDGLLNELNNFKSESMTGNDQIDDSIAAIQFIKKDIDDLSDKIDTVVNNLNDYNSNGRKYQYEL